MEVLWAKDFVVELADERKAVGLEKKVDVVFAYWSDGMIETSAQFRVTESCVG